MFNVAPDELEVETTISYTDISTGASPADDLSIDIALIVGDNNKLCEPFIESTYKDLNKDTTA